MCVFYVCSRIPSGNDVVSFPFPSSTYTVTLSGNAVVNNLTISGNQRLRVNNNAQLIVRDTATISARYLYIYGQLNVSRLSFSGYYIYGGSRSQPGFVTVNQWATITRGSYTTKYLRYISLRNRGTLMVDSSLDRSYYYWYLDYAEIINDAGATWIANSYRLQPRRSGFPQSNTLTGSIDRGHFINYGRMVTYMSIYSNTYWYFVLQNEGEVSIITGRYRSSYYLYWYAFPLKMGKVTSYFTSIYLNRNSGYSASLQYLSQGSDITMYGYPMRKTGLPSVANRPSAQWQDYINDVQSPSNVVPGYWDMNRQVTFRIQSTSNLQYAFTSLKTYGYVRVELSSLSGMSLNLPIQQTGPGYVLLGRNTNSLFNQLWLGNSTTTRIGTLQVYGGWKVTVAAASIASRVLMIDTIANASVTLTADSATPPKQAYVPAISIQGTNSLTVSGVNLDVDSLDVANTLYLQKSTLTVRNQWRWISGAITGTSTSWLVSSGFCNVSTTGHKFLSNPNLRFKASSVSSNRVGVLVDFFQYRIAGGKAGYLPYINSFPQPGVVSNNQLPANFNNLTTAPTYQRVELSLNRQPQNLGNGPILYGSDGNLDLTSPLTFTQNYATRSHTRLQIATTGNYTFYLRFYRGPTRLWFDGKVVFTTPTLSNMDQEYVSPPIWLTSGFHLMRLDMIQSTSGYFPYGHSLLISFSGPGVTKQLIPDNRLFFPSASDAAVLPQLCEISSDTLVSLGGSDIEVQSGRTVSLAGDVFWISSYTGPSDDKSEFKNSGSLVKTYGGAASFYMFYTSTGGLLQQGSGKISFVTPTKDSSPIFWNNPLGGSWNDASNWSPAKVPGPQSSAYITLTGSYTVVVGSNITVRTLVVGGGDSNPQLHISHFTTLNVTSRLDVLTNRLSLNGFIDAGDLTWAGRYITGSSVGTDYSSQITVRRGVYFVSRGSSSTYLQDISIINYGTWALGAGNTQSSNIYCQRCRIINYGTLFVRTGYLRLQSAPQFPSSGTIFRAGFINRGTIYMDIRGGVYSMYCYWDLVNFGTFTIVGRRYFPSPSERFYMYGAVTNNGTFSSYKTRTYIYTAGQSSIPSSGSWVAYSSPLWDTSRPYPTSTSSGVSDPASFIRYVYGSNINSMIWDGNYYMYMTFYNFQFKDMTMGSVKTYGRVFFQFSGFRFTNVKVGSLSIGKLGQLQLSSYRGVRNTFTSTNVMTIDGQLYTTGNWYVQVMPMPNQDLTFGDRLVVSGNSSVVIRPGQERVVFKEDIIIPLSSSLAILGRNVEMRRSLSVYGMLTLNSSRAVLWGLLSWKSGSLGGKDGYLTLAGGCTVMQSAKKTLNGLNFGVQAVSRPNMNGVVAEYFTYANLNGLGVTYNRFWDDNSTCSTSGNCVPKSFDWYNTTGTIVRLEQSVSLEQVLYPAPTQFQEGSSTSVDNSSPLTLRYGYAVRRTAYLRVAKAGRYRFSIVATYRISRLWVGKDIVLVTTSYTSSGFPAVQSGWVDLPAGYTLLRVDELVISSSNRRAFQVFYEMDGASGFKSTPIPNSALFYTVPSRPSPTIWRPATQSSCLLQETGLVLMSNSATFNVTKSGVVTVEKDLLWYSVGFTTAPSSVSNAGLIRKSDGVGSAIFLARYSNLGGRIEGNVNIQTAISGGKVYFWNNINGGSWSDANSWLPNGVPTTNDYVFITLPGSYRVLVSGRSGVTCNTLEVGSSAANVDFRIDYFSSLTVTSLFILNSQSTTLHGPVTAATMFWSGQTISGSWHTTGNVPITVTKRFSGIQSSSYTSHTLTSVNLTVSGVSSFSQAFGSLTLDQSNITINRGASLLIANSNINVRSRSYTTWRQGFINWGTLKLAIQSSVRWYADIDNHGMMVFSQYCCCYPPRLYFYGMLNNDDTNAVAKFYAVRPYFYSQSRIYSRRGSLEFTGPPLRANLPPAAGNCQADRLDDYISDMFGVGAYNQSYPGLSEPMWDPHNAAYVYIYENGGPSRRRRRQTIDNRNLDIGSLTTRGSVYLRFYYRYNGNVTVYNRLSMGKYSYLQLNSGSDRTNAGFFKLPSSVRLDRFYAYRGWKMRVTSPNTMWTQTGAAYVQSGSTLTASSSSLSFNSLFYISSGATVTLQGGTFTVGGQLVHAGTLNMESVIADVKNGLVWSQGSISGGDTWLYIRGRSVASGSRPLQLSGNNMRLALQGQKLPQGNRGVLAEYFQYRVATATTPRLSSIQKFYDNSSSAYQVPRDFDDPNTQPTFSRIEQSVSYQPQDLGHAPIVYRTTGSYDSSSPLTFSYNYAVRYTFYLWVPRTGDYKFYFSGSRYNSRRLRLWLNDSAPSQEVSTRAYPQNVSISGFMGRGYNKLRLDVIQTSSAWSSSGNMLLVSYEIPGVLAARSMTYNLYYRNPKNTASGFAAPSYKYLTTPVCEVPDTASDICGNYSSLSCWSMQGSAYIEAKKRTDHLGDEERRLRRAEQPKLDLLWCTPVAGQCWVGDEKQWHGQHLPAVAVRQWESDVSATTPSWTVL